MFCAHLLSQSQALFPLSAPPGSGYRHQRRTKSGSDFRLKAGRFLSLVAFLHLSQRLTDDLACALVSSSGYLIGDVSVELLRQMNVHRVEITVAAQPLQEVIQSFGVWNQN